jgi:hypothetical protein
MVAPAISFWTSSSTSAHVTQFVTGSLGIMTAVYDYGTIDTGSTGSTVFFWIMNNATGSVGCADAVLTSSGQTYAAAAQLGLGHHDSGSASHTNESSYAWSMQSGSLTGSVYVSSSFYYRTSVGFSGSVVSSGALSSPYIVIYSGSSGNRLSVSGLTLSGSPDAAGKSGSGWLIASYIDVLNGTPQGSKTGSFCLKYQYT